MGDLKINQPMKWVIKSLGLLVVLALAVAVLAQPAAAQTNCSTKYTVKSGDNLSSIAATYKVNYLDVAAANNLKAPYVLQVGQVLCIPGATSSSSGSSSSSSSSSTNKGITFSVERTKNHLILSASNLPTKNFYYVRASSDFRGMLAYQKLGMLRTGKNTEVVKKFVLPDHLKNSEYLTVCMKNAVSDKATCRSFYLPSK